MKDVCWIGVLDTPTDEFSEELKKDVEGRLSGIGGMEEGHGHGKNVPVWVKDSDFKDMYDVFCHQVSSGYSLRRLPTSASGLNDVNNEIGSLAHTALRSARRAQDQSRLRKQQLCAVQAYQPTVRRRYRRELQTW